MENGVAAADSFVVPEKKKNLPYHIPIPLLGIYPKEVKTGVKYFYTNTHSNTVHNSQKLQATPKCLSDDEWINCGILNSYNKTDKQNVEYYP